ncbi:HIT-like protein [Exidia glandulosa HHB12029]|uniref:HIT-like protein n=1 Tax=Exidia glandulosa HHB12029 TaxID=1314781 RepID=A0A165MDG0_EXIGL|nr:HIT-like protein [Exidia glandulosa HHB12029]
MAPPPLAALRQYASVASPASLPPTVLFGHTDKTLTVYDKYNKSLFHLLVLPRSPALGSEAELESLQTLLKTKDRARDVLAALAESGETARKQIQEEMTERYGWSWGVRMGFHAVPSMLHVHLHVMSDDLLGEAMKNKKHYNSFHPTKGFWLPLEDVQAWLEADDEYYKRMSKLPKAQYEPLLKESLSCFRCDKELKTIPALKTHLQEEWDAKEKRELAKGKKRKAQGAPDGEDDAKKAKAEE